MTTYLSSFIIIYFGTQFARYFIINEFYNPIYVFKRFPEERDPPAGGEQSFLIQPTPGLIDQLIPNHGRYRGYLN